MKKATFTLKNGLKCFIFSLATLFIILAICAAPSFASGSAGVSVVEAEKKAAPEAEKKAAPETEKKAAPEAEIVQRTAVKKTPAGSTQANASATAEKMYYCGELYIFADSMVKTNYEMASVAAELKDALQSGSLTRSPAKLNSLIKSYNAVSDTYNTWVEVKGDLEFFIDTVGTRTTYSKSHLQIAYKRTLETITETKKMLVAAQKYYSDQSNENKRDLQSKAESISEYASKAAAAISPSAQKALSSYRSLFELFAQQSGLKLEYKTWQNPESE